MIKILQRYITKTIILATLLVALIILAVLFLLTLLAELKNIGIGDYGITQALFFVLLRLPNQLYQFFPMLILLGCVLGLNTLNAQRELAVMRASGFSIRKIMHSVLSAALLLIIVMSLMGEWVVPNLNYKAEIHKQYQQNAGEAVVTASGVWLHIGNNFIHVQAIVDRRLLEGVTRYQFDNQHRLLAAYYAKTLSYENDQWQMNDVVKTSFFDERTKSQSFPKMEWDLKFNPNLFNAGFIDPTEMSLSKLAKYVHYLEQNGLQASEYRYNFWQRIFQPVASLIMIFLAIPFVLGTFSTATQGWRMIVGMMVGFAFFIMNALLVQLCIVYQLSALTAAILPLIIFALFGFFLSKQLIRQ